MRLSFKEVARFSSFMSSQKVSVRDSWFPPYLLTLLKPILSASMLSPSTTDGYHCPPRPGQGRARCSAISHREMGFGRGTGGSGWEAQSWCWISHLTASGLARPWADGRAGGGWCRLLMPNKQGDGSACSPSTFSTEFSCDSRGRSVTFSVFLMTTQFFVATKPLGGRIVDTLTERFCAMQMLIYGSMMLMQTYIRVPLFLHEVKTLVRQSAESIINADYFYVKLISGWKSWWLCHLQCQNGLLVGSSSAFIGGQRFNYSFIHLAFYLHVHYSLYLFCHNVTCPWSRVPSAHTKKHSSEMTNKFRTLITFSTSYSDDKNEKR